MSNPEPSIRIKVDVTNPGQFFACCGLLELADRLWPGAEGWFENGEFCVVRCGTIEQLVQKFVDAGVKQLDENDDAASPLKIGAPFHLLLDWWQKIDGPTKTRIDLGNGEQLMTWSGKQCGPRIFRAMQMACAEVDLSRLLNDSHHVYDIKNGKASKKTISPFYFDARREETSLDIGFSPDEQNMSVMAYPAVESLSLVGLQRFRPAIDENRRVSSFLYTVWNRPLPPASAMATVSCMIPSQSSDTYRFTKPSRGGEYLRMFSNATLERSNHVGY